MQPQSAVIALVLMLLAVIGCRSSDGAGEASGPFVPHVTGDGGPVPRSWKIVNRFTQRSMMRQAVTSPAGGESLAKRRQHTPGMLTSLVRQVAGDEERRWWKRRRQRDRHRLERAAEIPSASASRQTIVLSAVSASPDPAAATAVPLLITEPAPGLPASSTTSASYDASEGATSSTSSSASTEPALTSIDHDSETSVDEVAATESSSASTTSQASTTESTTTTATTTTTTTVSSSTALTGANSEEYFADDHAAGGNVPTADPGDASDKSSVRLSNETSTQKSMDQATTRAPAASEFASRASAAVGRVLSQEENVPWPEAKSTKVIGTIIEDVHSPYQSARPESITAAALTGSAIATIVICAFIIVVTTAGASGYWWYRRRYLNRPETLNDRYAPSETGANGDDIFRVGYIHSPEMPRDSSEEMYSLDNDSFLTSLEAMTIPTYWTETIKHTKL